MDNTALSALQPILQKFLIEPKIYESNGKITVIIEKDGMNERTIKALEVIAEEKNLYYTNGWKNFIIY